MVKRHLLSLAIAALWLGACASPTGTQASVSVAVTRSSESWQFFAFMFFAIYALGVNLCGACAEVHWPSWMKSTIFKVALHLFWFFLCLWVIMFSAWGHNVLVRLLFRAKQG